MRMKGMPPVPFCTMVEWHQDFSADVYDKLTEQAGDGLPDGCLCRIVGIGRSGPKVIEVWQTPAGAQRFAEASGADISDMNIPPPDRVSAFETSAYVVAPA
jgi:hypothetical protein